MTRTRAIWLMVPAGAVDQAIAELVPRLAVGDTVIDGGTSYCRDDVRRAGNMAAASLHPIDVGARGGVAGQERGRCLMIGGDGNVVNCLEPILTAMKGVLGAAAQPVGCDTCRAERLLGAASSRATLNKGLDSPIR